MEKKKATVIALGFLSAALALGFLASLRQKENESTRRAHVSDLDFRPTQAQLETIALLESRVSGENPHFSPEDARRSEYAKLFTHMAATSNEPHVVQASLEAILLAYSSRSSKKESPDADLDKVLARHLKSQDSKVVAQALVAARIPLMSEDPGHEVPAALVGLASHKERPEKRLAALEALNLLPPALRDGRVLDCFEEALRAPEPYVVSAGLFSLENSALSFADPPAATPALSSQVTTLTEHQDPAVRGRALSVLSTLRWLKSSDERLTLGMRALSDPHPYVRAVAADLLGQNGQPQAIHALIAHIRDMHEARAAISYPKLDGTAGEMMHVLPGRRRVAEAALYALIALSTEDLALTLGGPAQSEETIQESATLAEQWYKKAHPNHPNPSKVD